ncbi:MAG: hypothetical protein GY809_14480 [Planctomycetes bacterium]|nr:hypothetical protein [Planctomycetota bacterium]
MARRKGGLQKNIRSIFQDAAIPDDIHVVPPSDEAHQESDPVVETSERAGVPQTEALPVQEAQASAPDVLVSQPQLEPSQAPHDEACISDPMIEGQMKKQRCEKGFSCCTSGFNDLCRARVLRNGKTVKCLEPKKTSCAYRISTLFKRLCQCPIRIHIAKKHGK